MVPDHHKALVLVLSAPSGAGKQTLLRKLRARMDRLTTTVSATTRDPRPGEVDGRDYHFMTREAFEQARDENAFVEWAEVHGNLYGTLKTELRRCLEAGDDVVMELDVQGMRNMRAMKVPMLSVFLMPPSLEELERRLRHRGANSDEDIALRLGNAKEEMAAKDEFDHVVVNDDVDRAADELEALIREAHARLNLSETSGE